MKSLSYLNKYFYKYRYRLLLGVLFIIIQNYFLAKMPVLIGETSDYLTGKRGENLNIDQLFWIGISLAGFYVLFNLIKGFFLFLTRLVFSKLSDINVCEILFIFLDIPSSACKIFAVPAGTYPIAKFSFG